MGKIGMNVIDITNAIITLEKMNSLGQLLDKNELLEAYKLRGLSYMQTEHPSEAITDFNNALKIIENMQKNNENIDGNLHAEIHASRGFLYFMSSQPDLAVRDLDSSVNIMDFLKKQGLSVNEEILEEVRMIKAGLTAYTNDDKTESIATLNKRTNMDENKKGSNQSYDKSRLANNYYFTAINYLQKDSKDNAIVNFTKCIKTFLEIDKNKISNDDLKILSSAYMCRAELFYINNVNNKSLEDYNKSVSIEEQLQKNGVEVGSFDVMDIIRLYTGRARVLNHINNTEKAIKDYIIALRFNKQVFDEFPDSQEDYYKYLEELIDCTIKEKINKNDILHEFLFPFVRSAKTTEAEAAERKILKKFNINC